MFIGRVYLEVTVCIYVFVCTCRTFFVCAVASKRCDSICWFFFSSNLIRIVVVVSYSLVFVSYFHLNHLEQFFTRNRYINAEAH